jgi:hypothetical protein
MSKPYKMKAAGHNNSPMQKNFPKDIGARPGETPNKNVLGGAAQGAKMGSMFGPWGTAIGAVAGGIFGGIKAGKAKKEEKMLALQAETQEKKDDALATLLEEKERKANVGYSGFENEETSS